jgi:hypothetical protein
VTRKQAKKRIDDEVEVLCSDQPTFDKILDEVFDDLEEAAVRRVLRSMPVPSSARPFDPGASIAFTVEKMVDACRNIGHDLLCGACASVFFTGASTATHDPTCRTRREDGRWSHCDRRLDELDNYCPACGLSRKVVELRAPVGDLAGGGEGDG